MSYLGRDMKLGLIETVGWIVTGGICVGLVTRMISLFEYAVIWAIINLGNLIVSCMISDPLSIVISLVFLGISLRIAWKHRNDDDDDVRKRRRKVRQSAGRVVRRGNRLVVQ